MGAPDNELDALVPQPVTVRAGGVDYAITPITTRELPAMLKACQPVLAELATGDMMAAFMNQAESVIAATAIGARVSRASLDELALDELLTLAAAVVEVNADFFARRIAPAITAAAERVAKALAGSSSTPDSAPPDSAA